MVVYSYSLLCILSQVFANILNLNLEFPEGEESLSSEAEGSVRALLCLDQEKRAGLREIQVRNKANVMLEAINQPAQPCGV